MVRVFEYMFNNQSRKLLILHIVLSRTSRTENLNVFNNQYTQRMQQSVHLKKAENNFTKWEFMVHEFEWC